MRLDQLFEGDPDDPQRFGLAKGEPDEPRLSPEYQKIRNYMRGLSLEKDYEIGEDGRINVFNDVFIGQNDTLPFPFGKIEGMFDIATCKRITSFDHMPWYVTASVSLAGSGIRSMRGMHKQEGNVCYYGNVIIDDKMTNIVGLAALQTVTEVIVVDSTRDMGNGPKTLHKFNINGKDLHEFQEMLIDAGLYDMARL